MHGEGGVHGEGEVCLVAEGMRGEGGHVVKGGVCGRGACVAGETATAADGTHPA